MSFNQKSKSHKLYSIALKSPNGNTVGFINLSSQFIRAVIGKQEEHITVADIHEKFPNGIEDYIATLSVELTEVASPEPISAEDF